MFRGEDTDQAEVGGLLMAELVGIARAFAMAHARKR
jgi:hypothetical protein